MAWLYQAHADWDAAERFISGEFETGWCHAVAKWQQTVEKAAKGLVLALYGAGILNTSFRPRHEVERYVAILIRLPRATGNKTIQQVLSGVLDQKTRRSIKILDSLAPQFPTRRNTEYPFPQADGQWTYPAAEGVFSKDEVQDFRTTAYRVLEGAERVVLAVRRRP
jgi:hypothetical protein